MKNIYGNVNTEEIAGISIDTTSAV